MEIGKLNQFRSTFSITVPLEMPVVAREHFNRWYSKKAYYCALTVADLPLQFCCVLMYVMITYLMTAQPFEMFRLGLFFIMAVMVTLIAQGFGMIVGAAFGVKVRSDYQFNCCKKQLRISYIFYCPALLRLNVNFLK